jgi:hypothetical protein
VIVTGHSGQQAGTWIRNHIRNCAHTAIKKRTSAHVEKPDEYMAVDSIRRYVIIESTTPKVTVIERRGAGEPLGMTLLKMNDILRIPEGQH